MPDKRYPTEVYTAARAAARGRVSQVVVREIVDAAIAAFRDFEISKVLEEMERGTPSHSSSRTDENS